MPEVIMQYEDYEGKMIAMKRKEPLIRCKQCAHYVKTGIKLWMCEKTSTVLSRNDYCSRPERKQQ